MLDVGEGLMILIIFPNDQVMLFDCNITGDNESTILKYLSDNIPFKMNPATGNTEQFIDVFVNSHRDEDHYRGLKKSILNIRYNPFGIQAKQVRLPRVRIMSITWN